MKQGLNLKALPGSPGALDESRDHRFEIEVGLFQAVLFDMDGVVTKTATIHTEAWKDTFDQLLKLRCGNDFRPFSGQDYLMYVDGRARADGVRSFLASRKIKLDEGAEQDLPGFQTVHSVGSLKNAKFLELLKVRGVEVYETTVVLIRSLRAAGMKIALITASENGTEILAAANLENLFDVKVDGVDARRLHLPGKPNPALFLEAARQLGVLPRHAVVIEDAAAGVEAGHRGHFALVIGVARLDNFHQLKDHGADVVVADLSETKVAGDKSNQDPGMALAELNVSENNWVVVYNEYSPESAERRESLCALGNGYFCTRGAAPESVNDGTNYPGTYLAGGYNRVPVGSPGFEFQEEQLVNLPNWLAVTFKINDGAWFDLKKVELLEYQQRLDLRQAILYRDIKFRDEAGHETTLAYRSFVHMRYPHLGGLEATWTAHNWSGQLTIKSAIDGRVVIDGRKVNRRNNMANLEYLSSTISDGTLSLGVITKQSRLMVAQSARHELFVQGRQLKDIEPCNITEPGYAAQEMTIAIAENTSLTLQKIAAIYSSRDRAISEPGQSARQAVAAAPDFDSLLSDHIEDWRSLWSQFDLFVDTTEEHSKNLPSLLLHLNSFHTLQTASPNTVDLDVGLPARGWTGEGYQGHVFWDAFFVFPFITLRMPAIAASLLKYRYHRLDSARQIAQSMGVRGARFPWQSGSDGREDTPLFDWHADNGTWTPDNSGMQIHVNSSIAYDIWQYYQVTADLDFMNAYGAEMLFEIARFFASVAIFNPERDRYEIRAVVGPDEFHTAYPGASKPGIDNNAFTNLMAAWTITTALELLQLLPADHRARLLLRLKITDEERALWDDVSRKMYVPFFASGIISQFEGYDKLLEFPSRSDGKHNSEELKRLLEKTNGTPNEYAIGKQADVLMLFYVFSSEELDELFTRLGYKFEPADIRRNIDYYLPKTVNQSTLGRVAHAWVLSRLDRLDSWRLLSDSKRHNSLVNEEKTAKQPGSWSVLLEALGSDYLDILGGTADGIHLGAMAGTIDIVQRCYTGLVARKDVLWLSPQLPTALTRLSFGLHYRGQSLHLDITHERIKVTALYSTALPIKVGYKDAIYEMNAGETKIILLYTTAPATKTA